MNQDELREKVQERVREQIQKRMSGGEAPAAPEKEDK